MVSETQNLIRYDFPVNLFWCLLKQFMK